MLQTDNVVKYIFRFLDDLNQKGLFSGKRIILYEYNAQAKIAVAYFKNIEKISHILIVDADTYNHEKRYNGIPIDSPEKVLKCATENDIIIVFDHGHEKKTEILKINHLLEDQIYEIAQFNYADFPCRLEIPSNAKNIELCEAHAKLYDLLDYFDGFCSKYGLRYFLDGGSLLGAVRHQGIIPWDDDIDVIMPMPDYLKLCELLPKECDKKYEFRCSHANDQENPSLATVSKLLLRDVVTDSSYYPVHIMTGMWLDIFALAGFPDNIQEQKQYSLELEYLGDYWKENVLVPYNESQDFKRTYQSAQSKLLKGMTKYNYDECNYVGYAYCGVDNYLKNMNRAFPKKIFSETIQLEFGNRKYPCPKEYDYCLSYWYGDYMQLPPVEQRTGSHSGSSIYLLR